MSRESSTGQCCSSTLNTARQTSYLPSVRTPGLLQTQKDITFVSLLRMGGQDREIFYSSNIFDLCISASWTIWQLCLVKSFLLGIQKENISHKIYRSVQKVLLTPLFDPSLFSFAWEMSIRCSATKICFWTLIISICNLTIMFLFQLFFEDPEKGHLYQVDLEKSLLNVLQHQRYFRGISSK